MRRRLLLAAFLGLALAQGNLARAAEPSGPQPELPKEKLTIITRDAVRHDFMVEMATTQEQEMTGLMFRTAVPPDGGMLFDWGRDIVSQMWMKNTLIPLDMLFIAGDGTIKSIAENTVPRSLATIDAHYPVRATLEVAAGTAARLNIRVGDHVINRLFAEGK